MDNQNYDPINSEGVGTTETTSADAVSTGEVTTQDNTPILNQEVAQTQTYDFKTALDVEYRENPSITKFGSINDMAKSYVSLQSMLGKEKAVIPQDVNDKEAVREYMSKLGLPDDVNGYELKYDQESLGRELDLDGLKQVAFENNMTPSQVQAITDMYAGTLKSTMANESEQRQEAIAQAGVELRKEWGAAYDEKISKTKSFFEQNFPSLKDNNALMEQVGNNPQFIKDMSNLVGKFSEANIGDIPKQVTMTPAEAKMERAKLMNSEAYLKPSNTEHQATIDKARELLQIQMSG